MATQQLHTYIEYESTNALQFLSINIDNIFSYALFLAIKIGFVYSTPLSLNFERRNCFLFPFPAYYSYKLIKWGRYFFSCKKYLPQLYRFLRSYLRN